jgi:hypothetical protein
LSNFTVRVALHGASADDYDLLHERMEAARYNRFIWGQNEYGDGYWCLPPAEYDHTADADVIDIREQVLRIANSVRPGSWVLVTEAASRAWSTEPLNFRKAA